MAEVTFRAVTDETEGSIEASFWGRFDLVGGLYLTLPAADTEVLRRSVAEPIKAADRQGLEHKGIERRETGQATDRHTRHLRGNTLCENAGPSLRASQE